LILRFDMNGQGWTSHTQSMCQVNSDWKFPPFGILFGGRSGARLVHQSVQSRPGFRTNVRNSQEIIRNLTV
jgi:hypothetical protein